MNDGRIKNGFKYKPVATDLIPGTKAGQIEV